MANLVLCLWTSEAKETRSWSAGGVSCLLYCNLWTREPIFNFKMFSNLRISKRVKYGVAFSLLSAKKMQRRQLLWLIFISHASSCIEHTLSNKMDNDRQMAIAIALAGF